MLANGRINPLLKFTAIRCRCRRIRLLVRKIPVLMISGVILLIALRRETLLVRLRWTTFRRQCCWFMNLRMFLSSRIPLMRMSTLRRLIKRLARRRILIVRNPWISRLPGRNGTRMKKVYMILLLKIVPFWCRLIAPIVILLVPLLLLRWWRFRALLMISRNTGKFKNIIPVLLMVLRLSRRTFRRGTRRRTRVKIGRTLFLFLSWAFVLLVLNIWRRIVMMDRFRLILTLLLVVSTKLVFIRLVLAIFHRGMVSMVLTFLIRVLVPTSRYRVFISRPPTLLFLLSNRSTQMVKYPSRIVRGPLTNPEKDILKCKTAEKGCY